MVQRRHWRLRGASKSMDFVELVHTHGQHDPDSGCTVAFVDQPVTWRSVTSKRLGDEAGQVSRDRCAVFICNIAQAKEVRQWLDARRAKYTLGQRWRIATSQWQSWSKLAGIVITCKDANFAALLKLTFGGVWR